MENKYLKLKKQGYELANLRWINSASYQLVALKNVYTWRSVPAQRQV